MKRLVGLVLFLFVLVLSACGNDVAFKAEKEHFDGGFFENELHQGIGIAEGKLVLTGDVDAEAKRESVLDDWIVKLKEEAADDVSLYMDDVKIKVKDDQYTVMASDGLELVFTRVGERIIEDELGMQYSTPVYLE